MKHENDDDMDLIFIYFYNIIFLIYTITRDKIINSIAALR